MGSSCKNIREELIACLKASRCMREQGRSFHECMKLGEEEGECWKVRVAYTRCKMGQIDPRMRFRGNVVRDVDDGHSAGFLPDSPSSSPPSSSSSSSSSGSTSQ